MNGSTDHTTTIYDIAKRASVAPATVSKVLNNKGSISEETQKKILEIAAQMNYTPNPAARYLKTKQTNQIMLSIPSVRDLFFSDIIQEVQNACRSNDYSLLINSSVQGEMDEIRTLSNLGNNFIDGLILVSVNYTKKHFEKIKKIKRPVILCSIGNKAIEDFEMLTDFVGVDTKKGIMLSTRHLIENGYTEIGFVGLDINNETGYERHQGFVSAMHAHGLEVNEDFVITGGADEIFGYEAGLKYANMTKMPDALCVSADQLVIGLYKAFESKGIRVPEDIAIVGMDDTFITDVIKPKLSSVNLSQSEIGKTAADLLFRRIGGDDSALKSIIYQPKLIVRESSTR